MSQPIGLLLQARPPTLTNDELDVVCRLCNRRRGDHSGPRGERCPNGNGYSSAQFERSPVSADATQRQRDAEALIHARGRGVVPVWRRLVDEHGWVRFELANVDQVYGVWDGVLP